MIDVSEAVRKPSGVVVITPYDGSREQQLDTVQCVHCGYTWVPQPGSGKRRGMCMHCNGPLCGRPSCVANGCFPIEKQLEEMEFVNFTPHELVTEEQWRDICDRLAQVPARRATIRVPTSF